MAAYQSIVAYDGTGYQGFQRLAPGLPTVQGVLEDALRAVGWTGTSLLAAGRTDAGVHARGQVIAYDLAWRHPAETLSRALNANLPADVAVRRTERAAEGFHPRFSARRRTYSYSLLVDAWPDPLAERFAWRLWPGPDLESMNAEAQALIGRHDYAAFGQAPIPGGHTRREVFQAEWRAEAKGLVFVIQADAFLQHMVRRLVAALVSVGRGIKPPGTLAELVADPRLRWLDKLAPPQGLCLEAVEYGSATIDDARIG
jgi:tRNA pseudouridine38-40 synthase